MTEPRYIKNLRQKRAIATLLSVDSIAVKDIGPIIGAHNPRQTIMELRRQGFLGIIETRRYTILDRDGKICRPGEYLIPSQLKPIARKVLDEYTASKTKHREANDKNHAHHNEEALNDSTK